MSNLTGVTNLLPTVNEGFTTTVNGDIASNAATVPLNSVSGLTDGTVFVGIVEPGDATKQQVFTGTVDVANSRIINAVYTRGTSASGHLNGSTVVDYVTGTAFNMLSKALQQQHNQNGTHGVVTATSLTASAGLAVSGGSVTLPANSVQALALATNVITLGYAQNTAGFTTSSTTVVQATSLSAAVTIPAGGRRVKITVFAKNLYTNPTGAAFLTIWDGTVGSGTQLAEMQSAVASGLVNPGICMAVVTPSAGAKTYNVGIRVSTGTGGFDAGSTSPAFLLVETI